MKKGENTRSGLLWEVERLLNECKELPEVLLMENVPQVHGTKNRADFNKWIAFLESKGYTNYWADLNAKDYEIPQNRNRCFMVSILGNYNFEFPKIKKLKTTMANFLEPKVDEKYILSLAGVRYVNNPKRGKYCIFDPDVACTILSRANQNWNGNFISCTVAGELRGGKYERLYEQSRREYSPESLSPTLHTCGGGNQEIKIDDGECLRKLTPRECFRLMGFDDEDIDKCYSVGMSDSQLYKQAGNSIVVNVLEAIFKQML